VANKASERAEILRRLDSYGENDAEAVYRHLFDFGKMLLSDLDQSTERLDTKGRVMVAWNASVIAFVLTQIDKLPPIAKVVAVIAVLLALGSGVVAFLSIKVRDSASFSTETWLPDTAEAPRSLAGALRNQIYAAVIVRELNYQLNREKGEWLQKSQELVLLSVGALFFVVALKSFGL
jgi:hypothetical protein